MYKRMKDMITGEYIEFVNRIANNTVIPFDPANTDYVQFKTDIANGAELQDADGVVMTPEQVQAFMETLP